MSGPVLEPEVAKARAASEERAVAHLKRLGCPHPLGDPLTSAWLEGHTAGLAMARQIIEGSGK